jgi:hypothetical protein
VAYADPPYPGKSRLYRDQPTYGGEVDHAELISRLEREYPDGWALSTGAYALRDVLPLVPPWPEHRVCPWVKPHNPNAKAHGLANTWEPLIVVRGRQEQPGKRDWLRAHAARFGGDLVGRKPLAFAAWLFDCLGLDPERGDELDDLFPGTGVIGGAWRSLVADASPGSASDASPTTSRRSVA